MTALHFDCNATTAASDEVVAAMTPWLARPGANPSATHPSGREAARAVRAARESVARLVGARRPADIVFTSCGSESTTTAVESATARPGDFVTSTAEHSATRVALDRCAERAGKAVHRIAIGPDGALDRPALFRAIEARPALVSLILVNNETGVVSDLSGIGAACRSAGALFHIDAVQAPAKTRIDVEALGCDFLSLSAHKFHGPRGIGALFVRDGVDVSPLIVGGPQEGERRAGTENVPAIVGMGVAAVRARERAESEAEQSDLAARRDRLEAAILGACPGSRVHGATGPRVANTSNIGFDLAGLGLDATALLAILHDQGVEVSAGSACNATKSAPSPVLMAMGLDEQAAGSALRFSLAHRGTPDAMTDLDVDRCADAVSQAFEMLQALAT